MASTSMDMSSISTTSTCFSGNASAEAEDLRQRRDRLVIRATDCLAAWDTIKDREHSLTNRTDRGDFDETIEIFAADLNVWRSDSLAFAATFEAPDVKRKMSKKVQNHVRREKTRLKDLRTLYDEDDEATPP